MATDRPHAPAHVDALLSDLLVEMRGMRGDLRSLGERMAAHPEASDLRNALERLRVVEERETTLRERVVKAESKSDALAAEVQTLKTTGATAGVTLTGVHKVAGAVLGLITLALVALVGFLWRR